MYYHINPQTLTVIAGPYDIHDSYFRKLTRCGNPESLNLAAYGIVPQVCPTLADGNQYTDQITIHSDRVEVQQEPMPVVIPTQLTNRQAKLILHRYGLLTAVNSVVSSLGTTALIEWEYAGTIERSNPLIDAVAQQAGMSAEQVDQMFAEGALL